MTFLRLFWWVEWIEVYRKLTTFAIIRHGKYQAGMTKLSASKSPPVKNHMASDNEYHELEKGAVCLHILTASFAVHEVYVSKEKITNTPLGWDDWGYVQKSGYI